MSKDWPIAVLGNQLTPVSRPENVEVGKAYRLLGTHWYAQGLYIKDTLDGAGIRADKVYRVEEGDFVYNRLFAWKGAFAVATSDVHGCYVSNEFPCFHVKGEKLDPRYLKYYMSRQSAWTEALGLSTGGTPTSRNRLKEERMLAMNIPLPPITEQRRLVARIDALAAKIETVRELKKTTANERDALVRAALDQAYDDAATAYGLAKLENICGVITDGTHLTPTFSDQGIRFIFVGNVSSGRLHFNNCKFVTPDHYQSLKATRKPQTGDILYSAVGATLGIPAIVDQSLDFCFQRHIALIRPLQDRILPKYLWHVLKSGRVFSFAWSKTTGSAQPTIPLGAIRRIDIPMPPLTEQHRIVAYLDTLSAKTEALKKLQNDTAAELKALLPSILDQAFKGQL